MFVIATSSYDKRFPSRSLVMFISVVQRDPQLLCILQSPPFCSRIYLLLFLVSSFMLMVILSLVLFFLSMAGERKKYKSKSISFFFMSGKSLWQVIEVMKSLSVILKRQVAKGIFLKSTLSSNILTFAGSSFILEILTNSLGWHTSSPV